MTAIYDFSVMLMFVMAAIVFLVLFFVTAPYGKFLRRGWGPSVKSRWAWMIMELPSPALMAYFFFNSGQKNTPQIIFLSLWLLHYLHRTFIYPFTQSGGNKSYPVLLVCMAFVFNCANGFINGFGIFHLLSYDQNWLYSWQFMAGILVFCAGFVINKTADGKFRRMRKENSDEYVVPEGWLFNLISSPHYFGEIIEWGGWAILTWSLPGFAFFIFTLANLFPRGFTSHKWYKENFPSYPADRKAVIPFII